jgi:hypothetical protein
MSSFDTGVTSVGSLAVLFFGSRSSAALLTVAVLITDGAASGPTATRRVRTRVASTPSTSGRVQLTVWPTALHTQPEPVPET